MRYNGGVSEMNCVTYGVPKGSVLGPFVFPHIHSGCILYGESPRIPDSPLC